MPQSGYEGLADEKKLLPLPGTEPQLLNVKSTAQSFYQMHYATFKTALDFLLFYELIVAKKKLLSVPLYQEVSLVMSDLHFSNVLAMCLLIWHLSQTRSQS